MAFKKFTQKNVKGYTYMARAQIPPSANAASSQIFGQFTVKITIEVGDIHKNKGLSGHI